MTDVSTRLLEAIAGVERHENGKRRLVKSGAACPVCGCETVVSAERRDSVSFYEAQLGCGHRFWDRQELAGFWEPAPDPSVLRLCQAHREIVELAITCRADYMHAAEKRARYVGILPLKASEAETETVAALARLQMMECMVDLLASAYGLETPTEDR